MKRHYGQGNLQKIFNWGLLTVSEGEPGTTRQEHGSKQEGMALEQQLRVYILSEIGH